MTPSKKILIADDDDTVRRLLHEMLWRDYRVCCVSNGRELYQLLSTGHEFDLVITDVSMPHWDGDESIEMAKCFSGDVPVIFISGYAEVSGMAVLRKPFQRDQLLEAVHRSLGEPAFPVQKA